jgi:hypothetical protein
MAGELGSWSQLHHGHIVVERTGMLGLASDTLVVLSATFNHPPMTVLAPY